MLIETYTARLSYGMAGCYGTITKDDRAGRDPLRFTIKGMPDRRAVRHFLHSLGYSVAGRFELAPDHVRVTLVRAPRGARAAGGIAPSRATAGGPMERLET